MELLDYWSIKKEIAKKTGIPESKICAKTSKTRFSNINGEFTDIKVIVKDPLSKEKNLYTICEVSDFFDKFKDTSTTAFHELRN